MTFESSTQGSPMALEETTCHMLPCDIDIQGMAPTHLYFQPKQLENGVSSAMFRGRGLLAKEGSSVPAALLVVDKNDKVQLKSPVTNIVDWRHEHVPDTLQFNESNGRILHAQEWCEVADALHESLPLDEHMK